MENVRFGIVGLGNQGSHYNLKLFDGGRIENGVVTALCDIDPEKIETMRAKTANRAAAYFTDYREMLDSGLCDAVLVEVPHYGHCEIVRECLARNIHVLCEKPAGVYASEVRGMNACAGKSQALFGMMFNQRTNGMYQKIREMIAAGELGSLQRVVWVITDWYRTQHYYDSGSWRATWGGEGGGVLINQCPHQLDLLQWVVGEMLRRVTAFCHLGKWHDIEVEDDVTAYLEYANGATGVFVTTTGEYPGSNRLEISGSRGKLLCEKGKLHFTRVKEDILTYTKNATESFRPPESETVEIPVESPGPQHAGIINNFVNAILGREKLFVSGEEGLSGVLLMNAIELSGWLGKTVEIPFDEALYKRLLDEHVRTSRVKKTGNGGVSDTSGTF